MTKHEAAMMQTASAIKKTSSAVERFIDIARKLTPNLDEDARRGTSSDGEAATHHAATVLDLSASALHSLMDVIEHKTSPLCDDGKPHTKECKKSKESTDKTFRMLSRDGKPFLFGTSSSGSSSDLDGKEATLVELTPRAPPICVPIAVCSGAVQSISQDVANKGEKEKIKMKLPEECRKAYFLENERGTDPRSI